jgi:hypothetical protein
LRSAFAARAFKAAQQDIANVLLCGLLLGRR